MKEVLDRIEGEKVLFFIVLLIIVGLIICFKKDAKFKEKVSKVTANQELDARIKFLLKQFVERKLTIKEEYIMPSRARDVTPENLEYVLNSILDHMKLKKNVFLVYHTKDEKIYVNKAGTYDQAYLGYKAINLVLDSKYVMEDYISIIAHECAHHFMGEYNFEIRAGLENEKNTDTLAVLLGFGKFLKVTHAKRYFYKRSNFTVDGTVDYYETVKLGYLSAEEIIYISKRHLDILKNGKKQKKLKKEEREKDVSKSQNLKHRVEQLRRGYKENKAFIQRILSNQGVKKITNKWELERLSQLIYKYQNNTYEPMVEELNNKIEKGNESVDIIKKINELDEMLRMDSFLIAKYLIK